jgi:hypothetical protein
MIGGDTWENRFRTVLLEIKDEYDPDILKAAGFYEETSEVSSEEWEHLKERMQGPRIVPPFVIYSTPRGSSDWIKEYFEDHGPIWSGIDWSTAIYRKPYFTLREYEEQRHPLMRAGECG